MMMNTQPNFSNHSVWIAGVFLFLAFANGTSAQSPMPLMDQLLFDDRFETLRPGSLMPVVGPHSEYHYLPEAIPFGPWAVTAFDSGNDTQTAWRSVRLEDGSAALQQVCRNMAKHWHPMVVAGGPNLARLLGHCKTTYLGGKRTIWNCSPATQ